MTLTLISRDPLTSILSGYGVGQPGQFSIRSFYALPRGIYDVFVVGTGRSLTRVVLVPTGARQQSYGLYRTVTSDLQGRFSFDGVPPGEYKLFAWAAIIPDGAWTNEEYLAPYQDRGTVVTASAGSWANVELELILD